MGCGASASVKQKEARANPAEQSVNDALEKTLEQSEEKSAIRYVPKLRLTPVQGDHYIQVQSITGQVIPLPINAEDTFAMVEARLRHKEDGPLFGKNFNLIHNGSVLESSAVAANSGIAKGSKINAVLLKGEIEEIGGEVEQSLVWDRDSCSGLGSEGTCTEKVFSPTESHGYEDGVRAAAPFTTGVVHVWTLKFEGMVDDYGMNAIRLSLWDQVRDRCWHLKSQNFCEEEDQVVTCVLDLCTCTIEVWIDDESGPTKVPLNKRENGSKVTKEVVADRGPYGSDPELEMKPPFLLSVECSGRIGNRVSIVVTPEELRSKFELRYPGKTLKMYS